MAHVDGRVLQGFTADALEAQFVEDRRQGEAVREATLQGGLRWRRIAVCGSVLLTLFIVGTAYRIEHAGHGELMQEQPLSSRWAAVEFTTFGLQSPAELKQSHGSASPWQEFIAAPFNKHRIASPWTPVALSPFPKPVTSRRHQLVGSNMNLKVRPLTKMAASDYSNPIPENAMAVRAPLKLAKDAYPVLSLRFPNMANPTTGEMGVPLDFLVDTAANVNTINGKLADALKLPTVGRNAPGIGTLGDLDGGSVYLLGDCQLNDLPPQERFILGAGLTAAALPLPLPVGGGLLGLAFLSSFPCVDFNWGDPAETAGSYDPDAGQTAAGDRQALEMGRAPSLTLYRDFGGAAGTSALIEGLVELPIKRLPSGLVSVPLVVNGVEIPSLLDTGSPITILNAAAAEAAGVAAEKPDNSGKNPLARAKDAVAEAANDAAAVAAGEVLLVGPSVLRKYEREVPLAIGNAPIGDGRLFVGEVPGLGALDGLGANAGPAAILGTDVLRCRRRLLLLPGRVFV